MMPDTDTCGPIIILISLAMLNKEGLHSLLELNVKPGTPSFIIYSERLTARLDYVCEFVFKHQFNVTFEITDRLAEFEKSSLYKINYSNRELSNALRILPNGLLDEKGNDRVKPEPVFKNGSIYFYESKTDAHAFHFDVFSSVFYFISRYEEWQSFETDVHKRFEAKASILFQYRFHLKPVVDHWILELRLALERMFVELKFPQRKFKLLSTIDVDNLYAYKSKGFIRTIGASLKDVIKLDFKNLKERILVLSGKQKDPFDIYDEVSEFCLNNKIPLIYFFLFKSGTQYDRTLDPDSGAFKKVFDVLQKNWALEGIHPSYNSAYQEELLKNEVTHLSKVCGKKINLSRQHFLRFDIKSTPELLLKNGIIADFSMGFASSPGFRAGTSYPFFYYDFKTETKTELLFVPFCVMDGAYTVYTQINPQEALESLMELAAEVKKVEGFFISVFHERTFSNHLYKGFGTLYKNLHLKLKDL